MSREWGAGRSTGLGERAGLEAREDVSLWTKSPQEIPDLGRQRANPRAQMNPDTQVTSSNLALSFSIPQLCPTVSPSLLGGACSQGGPRQHQAYALPAKRLECRRSFCWRFPQNPWDLTWLSLLESDLHSQNDPGARG